MLLHHFHIMHLGGDSNQGLFDCYHKVKLLYACKFVYVTNNILDDELVNSIKCGVYFWVETCGEKN
jgi:hypothetical protein